MFLLFLIKKNHILFGKYNNNKIIQSSGNVVKQSITITLISHIYIAVLCLMYIMRLSVCLFSFLSFCLSYITLLQQIMLNIFCTNTIYLLNWDKSFNKKKTSKKTRQSIINFCNISLMSLSQSLQIYSADEKKSRYIPNVEESVTKVDKIQNMYLCILAKQLSSGRRFRDFMHSSWEQLRMFVCIYWFQLNFGGASLIRRYSLTKYSIL